MVVLASPVAEPDVQADRQVGTIGRLALAIVGVAGLAAAVPQGFALLWYVPYAGVGAVLIVRRPQMSIGWILAGLGLAFVAVTTGLPATADDFAKGTLSPGLLALLLVGVAAGPVIFLLIGLLAVVFPSGHLPVGRWRRVTSAALAIAAAAVLIGLVTPSLNVNLWASSSSITVRNPFALWPDLPIWQVIGADTAVLPVVAFMALAAGSLFVRYRRAEGVERQQLRWIASALVLVVVAVVGGFLIGLAVPSAAESGVIWVGAILAFPTVPIAVGIAVQRYHLYDIDTIINRAVVYALVTSVLAGTMAATVALSKQLFEGAIGSSSEATTIVSTLVIVSVFEPVKSRVQALVDRRLRVSSNPATALSTFVIDVRASVAPPDPTRTLERFAAVAAAAYRGSSASVRWTDGERESVVLVDAPRRGGDSIARAGQLAASAAVHSYAATVELTGVLDRRDQDALGKSLTAVLQELPVPTQPPISERPALSR